MGILELKNEKTNFTLLIGFVLASTLMTFLTGLIVGLCFSPDTLHILKGLNILDILL